MLASAEQHVREGRLDEALAQLEVAVRGDASSARLRVFLFQLLCVRGDWDRALRQLQVAAQLDPANEPMARAYREVIRCELFRRELFEGRRAPLLFGEPEAWVAHMVEAVKLDGVGEHDAAARVRERAFEEAPAVGGDVDELPFAWIADGDSRLGPLFEAFINGQYYWVPLTRLRIVELEPPTDLRDLVWLPAQITTEGGSSFPAFLPVRYPSSETSSDSMIRLSRRTSWRERAGEYGWVGLGQRVFVSDKGEHALLETRRLVFRTDSVELSKDPGGG